jgi:hypothetical protein
LPVRLDHITPKQFESKGQIAVCEDAMNRKFDAHKTPTAVTYPIC